MDYRESVEIEWGIFLPAVVLLYYPAERIFPMDVRLRSFAQLSDPAAGHRHRWWWWQPVLWADAVRIGLAVWLVHFSIAPGPDASTNQVLAVVGGLFLLGLVPQMVTRRKANAMFAPLGYVLAALFVLLPFAAALPVAVLGLVGLMAMRNFTALFLGGSIVTMVLGYLLGGSFALACLVAAVFALPVVVGAMFGCKLVLPVRRQGEVLLVAPPR